MTRNVGPEDRVVRIVFAIGIAILIFVGVLEGLGAVIGGIVAAYLAITGVMRTCLVYKVAGLDTSVQEQPYSTTDDRSGL